MLSIDNTTHNTSHRFYAHRPGPLLNDRYKIDANVKPGFYYLTLFTRTHCLPVASEYCAEQKNIPTKTRKKHEPGNHR
jgi:hypothetical protein